MALAGDQRRLIWNSSGALVACVVVLTSAYFIIPALGRLPVDLAERLAFALRADLFVVVWVLVGTRLEAMTRFYQTPTPSPSSLPSKKSGVLNQAKTAPSTTFLQNTLEQAFIATVAHLVLATLLHGPALAVIPGAVMLFCAGRLAYVLDTSKGLEMRSFGMVLTALPTFAGYAFAIILIVAEIITT